MMKMVGRGCSSTNRRALYWETIVVGDPATTGGGVLEYFTHVGVWTLVWTLEFVTIYMAQSRTHFKELLKEGRQVGLSWDDSGGG
jgi:hypothetical protein